MKLFDIMRFMSDYGLDISRADTFIGAKKVKQGTEITMGADDKSLNKLIEGKCIPVLFLILLSLKTNLSIHFLLSY